MTELPFDPLFAVTFESLTPTTGGAWLMSTLMTIWRPCDPTYATSRRDARQSC